MRVPRPQRHSTLALAALLAALLAVAAPAATARAQAGQVVGPGGFPSSATRTTG